MASLALAGCGGAFNKFAANAPVSASNPGTSVTVKNPDPAKWMLVPGTGGRPGFWVCKPLACAGQAGVSFASTRSPTRNPDRTALEKAAKLLPTQFKAQDLMLDAASEGDERITSLSSKVTSMRDYPAIVAEAKRTTRGKATYILRADLFIGTLQVRAVSIASERAEAMKHFESFVAQLEIVDIEAPAVAAGPATEATTLGSQSAPAN